MMKQADSVGLDNTSSDASLCLAIKYKFFPGGSIMFLNYLWVSSISKFSKIQKLEKFEYLFHLPCIYSSL